MDFSKKLTESFNHICEHESDLVQQRVSQRLREYIKDWGDNNQELKTALATREYYSCRTYNDLDDFVEYLVCGIIVNTMKGGEVNVAAI